jgi:hypothetical protein
MNSLPENDSNPLSPEGHPAAWPPVPPLDLPSDAERAADASEQSAASPAASSAEAPIDPETNSEREAAIESPLESSVEWQMQPQLAQPQFPESPIFANWEQPSPPPAERIPNIGHFAFLGAIAIGGLLVASLFVGLALHLHMFGISTREQAVLDIHYTLGSEAILYIVTLIAALIFFPMLWGRGFFAGIQWNGATAFRLRSQLFMSAVLCFALALANSLLLPGPKDAPIDKIFHSPGAPWLLFAFGVTFAPFFEEVFFRGFMLPSLCTACDWVNERIRHTAPPPLGEHGHPQWSMSAMITGSIFTSLPFAAVHAAQTGYSIGPFVLLVMVSLVLCWTRLRTRSLAASVLVHASYNFLLFFIMLVGSNGFQHLDKM